jgi:hypothetical protein
VRTAGHRNGQPNILYLLEKLRRARWLLYWRFVSPSRERVHKAFRPS